jgi:hypothetical protein
MSSFFEELTEMINETTPGKVLLITLAILLFSGAVGLGFAYWITHWH